MVFVEPHGIVKPLSEVGFAPPGLLVEPAQVRDRRLCQTLGARCVFSGISQTEHSVGEVPVISKTTVRSHKGLIVPGLQELMQEGVSVHSQRPTDALHTAKVGLARSLDVEGHPVAHTAQKGDPRLIFVQNLETQCR